MKYTILFLFAMNMIILSSCSGIKDGKPSIEQGVFGRVQWIQGNQMPSPDIKVGGSSKPVVRKIHIYELTKLSDVKGQAPLFEKVNSRLIAVVSSNADGYFQCKLPIGRYSIFTIEDDSSIKSGQLFFANLFEGNGEITPFEVQAGKLTNYNMTINYKASY